MGEPIPPDPGIIDPAKVYCCKMSAWYGDGGCGGDYTGPTHCCHLGAEVLNWLVGGYECKQGYGLCAFLGFAPQRIESLGGPYDDFDACFDSGCLVF